MNITLTGADERTKLRPLRALNAEIGILYTAHPLLRNRYPRRPWIMQALDGLDRVALHICGGPAKRELLDGKLAGMTDGVQRIQLNGAWLALEVEQVCEQHPEHTIITQHSVYGAHLLCVKAANHAILMDSSGGRGVSPDDWRPPLTEKHVGFAGGLGPNNLAGELGRILPHAREGSWIDMEAHIRTDDWFSVPKAQECVRIFEEFLNNIEA